MEPNPVRIIEAREEHVPSLARVHYTSLPEDYLPSLGLRFLRDVYYPAAVRAPQAKTLVAVRDTELLGFVTVAQSSTKFSQDVTAGRMGALAYYALRRALRNPLHLWKSFRVFQAGLTDQADPVPAEIVFIAVSPEARRQKIATTLVDAGMEYLRAQQINACRTKTLVSNLHVIRLYEKKGWQIRETFRFLGSHYVTLVSPTLLPR